MDECDLKLANHGEGGQPSKDYAFTMQAGNFINFHWYHFFSGLYLSGGEEYFIQVKARATATHYLGEEKEARNTELFASFCVNGVPGYGMVEWNYRNFNRE